MARRGADRRQSNGFMRREWEEKTLREAYAFGMLWRFGSTAEEVGYPIPNGVERAYLDFLSTAVSGEVEVSEYFRNGFEGELRFLIHGGVAAVIEEGALRAFIPAVQEHHECRHPAGKEDGRQHTRFGYVEGRGEFFQEMREKRRISDFGIRIRR